MALLLRGVAVSVTGFIEQFDQIGRALGAGGRGFCKGWGDNSRDKGLFVANLPVGMSGNLRCHHANLATLAYTMLVALI